MSLDLKGTDQLAEPLRGADELVDYFHRSEKPPSAWRVGVEHEKIGVVRATLAAVPYYGDAGIRSLLDALARAAGGKEHAHKESGQPVAVLSEDSSVTLEPGGQLELSGAPALTLSAARDEVSRHLQVLRKESEKRDLAWLAAGYRPFGTRDEVPWMPKGRYAAMRKSLGPRGRLALDMMLMTATVQTNLDWSDENDLAEKVRAATSVSPIVSALFANSPIVAGKDSGWLDFRYQVWRECDPARCGLLEPMTRSDFSYRSYVEWALDVPMLFVRRSTEYLDARGQTFRAWLSSRKLAQGERAEPRLSNWIDHLTTLFPEVRVKSVLELRGADVVPPPLLHALSALWVGLLYDAVARRAAIDLTRGWSFPDRLDFQGEVAKRALRAKGPDGASAQELAREVVAIARGGLSAWAGVRGVDERQHLDPLDDVLAEGTIAERALVAFHAAGEDPVSLVRFWQVA